MKTEPLILALETALPNGSLSILKGEKLIDFYVGTHKTLRSEDILQEINNLLQKNNLHLNDLYSIAVSTGPGSFTGIRIGLATAQALALALNTSIIGISVLEALARSIKDQGETISVVPATRNQIFWQSFYRKEFFYDKGSVKLGSVEDFIKHLNLNSGENITIIAAPNLEESFKSLEAVSKYKGIINYASDNASFLIGLSSLWKEQKNHSFSENILPEYVLEVEIGCHN